MEEDQLTEFAPMVAVDDEYVSWLRDQQRKWRLRLEYSFKGLLRSWTSCYRFTAGLRP